jgi:GNAT superfamily N-acetyltransferase
MPITHYKRLQMELELRRKSLPAAVLPEGYAWAAWHPVLLGAHARVKYESFVGEIDAEVFESLSNLSGCQRLMHDIAHHQGFAAAATWLVRFEGNDFSGPTPCATIQGLKKSLWVGSVQNVGVLPAHRGFGLGRALMLKSLHGFRQLGTRRVRLEVTAANETAVELYRSLGFRVKRTSYRCVMDPADSSLAAF